MTKTYKLPLNGWQVSSKKKVSLNLNSYRNWHYQTSNKVKRMVYDYLLKYDFPKYQKIKLDIKIYFKDKRQRDLGNFESVASKFFLDALVERGAIPDDNYKYITSYNVEFGGYSDNNYVEYTILDII